MLNNLIERKIWKGIFQNFFLSFFSIRSISDRLTSFARHIFIAKYKLEFELFHPLESWTGEYLLAGSQRTLALLCGREKQEAGSFGLLSRIRQRIQWQKTVERAPGRCIMDGLGQRSVCARIIIVHWRGLLSYNFESKLRHVSTLSPYDF